MSFIEGFGDELIVFILLVSIFAALILAWMSTHVRDPPDIIRQTQTGGVVSQTLDFPGSIEDDLERIASEIEEEAEAVENELSVLTLQRSAFLQTLAAGETTRDDDDAEEAELSSAPENSNDENEGSIPTYEFPCPHEDGAATSGDALENPSPSHRLSDEPVPDESSIPNFASFNSFDPPSVSNAGLSRRRTNHGDSNEFITGDPSQTHQTLEGHMIVRIKFLNDVIKETRVKSTDTIRDFKAQYFAEEMASRSRVRLIFNGQLLADNLSFAHYNITNNTVVHCLVSRGTPGGTAGGAGNETEAGSANTESIVQELDLSRLAFPLVAVILGCVWYFRVQYRQFFNATSSVALMFLTVVFFFCVYTSLRNRTNENLRQPPPPAELPG